MKFQTLAILAVFGFSGATLAGTVGAGPGGTGSLEVGSIISSLSHSRAEGNSPRPGLVGRVTLETAQTASLAAYLKSQPGTVVNGDIITAPTVFADGTSGQVTLNTATGEFTLTRG